MRKKKKRPSGRKNRPSRNELDRLKFYRTVVAAIVRRAGATAIDPFIVTAQEITGLTGGVLQADMRPDGGFEFYYVAARR